MNQYVVFGEALREFALLRDAFEQYRDMAKELNYREFPADSTSEREQFMRKVQMHGYRIYLDFQQADLEDRLEHERVEEPQRGLL